MVVVQKDMRGSTADGQKEVMRITSGQGVDVVYDPVGMIVPSLKCVAWNARLVVVGFAAGTIEKVCPIIPPSLPQRPGSATLTTADPGKSCIAQTSLYHGPRFRADIPFVISLSPLVVCQVILIRTVKDPKRAFEIQHAVAKLLADRKLDPVTYEPIYEGLESVSRGLGDIEGRKTWGKGVVRVRRDDGGVVKGEEEGVKARL